MRKQATSGSDAPFLGMSWWLPLLTICALVLVAWLAKRVAVKALADPGPRSATPHHSAFNPAVEGRLVTLTRQTWGLESTGGNASHLECFPGSFVELKINISNRSVYVLGATAGDQSLAVGFRIGDLREGRFPLNAPIAPPALPERLQKVMPWPAQQDMVVQLPCPSKLGAFPFTIEMVLEGIGWQHDAKVDKPTWIQGEVQVRAIDDPDLQMKHPLLHDSTPRWSKMQVSEDKLMQLQRAYVIAARIFLFSIKSIEASGGGRFATILPRRGIAKELTTYTRKEFGLLREGGKWFGLRAALFSSDVAKLVVVPTEEEKAQEAAKQRQAGAGNPTKSGSTTVLAPSYAKMQAVAQQIIARATGDTPVEINKELLLLAAEYGELLRRYFVAQETAP